MAEPHKTIPVQVWADVDVGIAGVVAAINGIDGARTYGSCQGSMGEGGAFPYPAFVSVGWWTDEAKEKLYEYGLHEEGEGHGTCYPSAELLDQLAHDDAAPQAARHSWQPISMAPRKTIVCRGHGHVWIALAGSSIPRVELDGYGFVEAQEWAALPDDAP